MEQALQHIEEGRRLSIELGGTDTDVKNYFFNLSKRDRDLVFQEYGERFGDKPKSYAEEAFPEWKSGRRQMSGLVAGRLFKLLPEFMPLEAKLKLVKSLWEQKCPHSKMTYYVGPDVIEGSVRDKVTTYWKTTVTNYEIPDSIRNRFTWLAEGDARIQEDLCNYFLTLNRDFAADALGVQLPAFLKQVFHEESPVTQITRELRLGNHLLKIVFDPRAEGISETKPYVPYTGGETDVNWGCVIAAGIALLIFLLNAID
jgi:hypothetical protein